MHCVQPVVYVSALEALVIAWYFDDDVSRPCLHVTTIAYKSRRAIIAPLISVAEYFMGLLNFHARAYLCTS